jgi:hypothetical protein
MKNIKKIAVILILLATTACQTTNKNSFVFDNVNQLKIRSIQTKSFDTGDKNLVVRNAISTLQDLDFVIERADADLGTITATKLNKYTIKATVTVRPKGKKQMVTRINARYGTQTIDDPIMYQNFFSALSKSLFLTANDID